MQPAALKPIYISQSDPDYYFPREVSGRMRACCSPSNLARATAFSIFTGNSGRRMDIQLT
jgi:hypothetical protein